MDRADPIGSHSSAVATAGHGRTKASKDRPLEEASGSHRAWIFVDPETYFTIQPLIARDDAVLAIDRLDSLSWGNALANALPGKRSVFGSHRGEIIVVGDRIPAGFIGRAMTLQNYGMATVTFEPDAFALVERELAERPRDLILLFLADTSRRAMATHVARLASNPEQLVLAVSDPARVDRLVSTGRVRGVYSVGGTIPASITGRRAIPHLGRLDRFSDLVAFGMAGGGDAASPPAGAAAPPPGTRFTLAVWSGIPGYADYLPNDPKERPLSFYQSDVPASALCSLRADCLVANLGSFICANYPDCSAEFDPSGQGWLIDPEPLADQGIA